jgi:hypothetical protein
MLFVTIVLPGNAIEGPIGSARMMYSYKDVVEGIATVQVSKTAVVPSN